MSFLVGFPNNLHVNIWRCAIQCLSHKSWALWCEQKWIAARGRFTVGFSAAHCHTKCPKTNPFTQVFSWREVCSILALRSEAVVLFMLLHYFNFLFPSFAGFQVHPEAMTLIAASWGGCMDHRQSGGLTSGYEVRIAQSFCIFKCINTFWLLLFFPHLMSMQYLRRSHSQSQFTGKNCMSVLCFVWVFQLNQPRTCGCSYVNRKATCSWFNRSVPPDAKGVFPLCASPLQEATFSIQAVNKPGIKCQSSSDGSRESSPTNLSVDFWNSPRCFLHK